MVKVGRVITYECDLCSNSMRLLSTGNDEIWIRYEDGILPIGWRYLLGKLYCDKHRVKKTTLVDSIIVDSEDL